MKVQIEISSEDFAAIKPYMKEGENISSVCSALIKFAIPDAARYMQEFETEKEQQRLSARDVPFLRRNFDYGERAQQLKNRLTTPGAKRSNK